ncbi:MAG: triose-phosphate isomerase [Pseudomonadota bacterium]
MNRKRIPFIVGNWKMNNTKHDTSFFLKNFMAEVKNSPLLRKREIGIAPAFTSLCVAAEILKDSDIRLCSQNAHWDDSGQYTGEISPLMLKECDVQYAIIGHSERRKFFGETNDGVNKRIKGCIKNKLSVIMCVGETKEEREAENTQNVVKDHVLGGLNGISKDDVLNYVTIAYEPVWAIGTGLNATVEQAVEVHKFIRGLTDERIRILYGGSVKPENIDGFMNSVDIDGALVGGASLSVESFLRIVNFREDL